MSDKSESFEKIMNMTIHTLDETSMNNVSKMWVYIEEQQEKLQAAEEENRILREAVEHCVDDIIAISPDSERNTVCLSLVEDILEQALEKVSKE